MRAQGALAEAHRIDAARRAREEAEAKAAEVVRVERQRRSAEQVAQQRRAQRERAERATAAVVTACEQSIGAFEKARGASTPVEFEGALNVDAVRLPGEVERRLPLTVVLEALPFAVELLRQRLARLTG
jgi:hypothetical protein